VWVNNQQVLPATAIFKGDVIRTGKASSAAVDFRSGAAATIAENSEVPLSPDTERTSLNLRQGALVLRSAGRQPVRVSVLGTSVIAYGKGNFPAICRVAAVGREVAVFNDHGRVEIQGAGAPLLLPVGKFAQLEARSPQGAAGQLAGRVTAAIPSETVQHAGQTAELPLKIQDPINWEDLVKTQRTGRVRIELLDGSILNVGARSNLRVTKHDPQTQQTMIEMAVGRLRGEVVKITKPSGSFQVRTQTAVIGVVGTIFFVHATFDFTRVTCIEGLLTVQNINPAITGVATLHAGESTTVPRGLPPAGALQAPTGQIQSQVNETNVGGPSAGAGVAPGEAPGEAGTLNRDVTNATTTAAGAISAGTSLITISRVGDARAAATLASTNLEAAAAASNKATVAAQGAAAASANATSAIEQMIELLVSPSGP